MFGEKTSNQDIFEQTLSAKIDESFEGKNLTVLTYGISGSGKTHTIFGLAKESLHNRIDKPINVDYGSERGLIDLAMTQIFEKSQRLLSEDPDISIGVSINFIEIYNENIRDLLNSVTGEQGEELPRKKLSLVESTMTKGVSIPDLTQIKVRNR